MTSEELRAIMDYLRESVHLGEEGPESSISITVHGATEAEMIGAGLHAEGVKQILGRPWWEEMITDIIETPDFCDPDDPPHQVLEYARDVVSDYIQKRVSPNSE